jgi:hypothetical protein
VTPLGLDDRIERQLDPDFGCSALSPDGEWLLLRGKVVQLTGARRIVPIALRRTGFEPLDLGPCRGLRWLPNGQGWMAWGMDFRPDRPPATLSDHTDLKRSDFPEEHGGGSPAVSEYTLQDEWDIIGVIAPDRAVMLSPARRASMSGGATVRLCRFGTTLTTLSQYALRVPGLWRVVDGAVSPDGRRLCWITLREPSGTRSDGLITSMWPRGDAVVDVWVSAIDGNGLRRIADLALPGVPYEAIQVRHRIEWLPRGLQWIPGEERVSFLWSGRLWAVGTR